MQYRENKGITSIEAIVILLVICVVIAIAYPGYMSKQDRAKHARLKQNMYDVQAAVEEFYIRADGIYPGDLPTDILTANPGYNGDEPNTCVANSILPPYGPLSILDNHVRNPFNSATNALMDGEAVVPVGITGYQASKTPGDDPITGAPWSEAGDGPATVYRITGYGKSGGLPLVLVSFPY